MLTEAGFALTTPPKSAECLIVNTCAFIDRAREESVNTILELAKLKERRPVPRAHRHRLPDPALWGRDHAQGDAGDRRASSAPRSCTASSTSCNQADGRQDWATAAPPGYLYDAATPAAAHRASVPYAYVKIAEGCDMGCTFCAIPQFRGAPPQPSARRHRRARSRGSPRRGVQEAILVSQDTLAYGRDLPGNGDIGDLLLALGDTRDAVDPPDVPAPGPRQRPPGRRVGRARAWCPTSTCRSSTPTTAC